MLNYFSHDYCTKKLHTNKKKMHRHQNVHCVYLINSHSDFSVLNPKPKKRKINSSLVTVSSLKNALKAEIFSETKEKP